MGEAEQKQNLELEVGTPVQLQFGTDGASQRYATKIIGYVHPTSIILHTPQNKGKPMLLREGQITTARFLGTNNVYAFVSNVRAVFLKPFPHLHIAYPSEIKSAFLRQAERVRTDIHATAVNLDADPERKVETRIVNISANGALVASADALGEVGAKLRVVIGVEFNDTENGVAVVAVVRNIRKEQSDEGDQYHHGVQFIINTITDYLMVQGVVYSQLSSA